MATASDVIADNIHQLQLKSPDAPIFIAGDFNQCRLNNVLPNFDQYINIPTRNDATLDLCYGNIPKAYTSKACHQLGNYDHLNIQLVPVYKQKLKKTSPVTRQRYAWSHDATERLRACFECTDWDAIFNPSDTLDEATEVVTDYVNFCVDANIPRVTTKIFPNNKPWVSKELRDLLKLKERARTMGDRAEVRHVQKRIKREVESSKESYKDKIEGSFKENDPRSAWKTLQRVTGYKQKSSVPEFASCQTFVDKLNKFYCRFDTHDFSQENSDVNQINNVIYDDNVGGIELSDHVVRMVLGNISVNKAPGPDRLCNKVAEEL